MTQDLGSYELVSEQQKAQVRYSQEYPSYEELPPNIKETLWWASGLDFFTMPTYVESKKHYISMYVGFSDGLSYFQPCYIRSNIWDQPFIGDYASCNVDPP